MAVLGSLNLATKVSLKLSVGPEGEGEGVWKAEEVTHSDDWLTGASAPESRCKKSVVVSYIPNKCAL